MVIHIQFFIHEEKYQLIIHVTSLYLIYFESYVVYM